MVITTESCYKMILIISNAKGIESFLLEETDIYDEVQWTTAQKLWLSCDGGDNSCIPVTQLLAALCL